MMRSLPRRRSSGRLIALTPLVDIVFLLLTFFMLSSQLSPFPILELDERRIVEESTASPMAVPAPAGPGIGSDILLSVGFGRIRLNGVEVPAAELMSALSKERGTGAESVTILTAQDATLQDFVTALEAAKVAAFASIAIANVQ